MSQHGELSLANPADHLSLSHCHPERSRWGSEASPTAESKDPYRVHGIAISIAVFDPITRGLLVISMQPHPDAILINEDRTLAAGKIQSGSDPDVMRPRAGTESRKSFDSHR